MSRKRKSTAKTREKKADELITYQVFFQESLTKNLVKPWQERELHAFFKDLGLTDKETADKYKDALAKY